LGSYTKVCKVRDGGSYMGSNQVDMDTWQKMAQQVLGGEFFADFYTGVQQEGPSYNLYRNSSEIIVLINLPYIRDLSQIKLSVREQELYIKGKVDLGYDHLESVQAQIFSGTFEKTIPLPEIVNTKRVNAQYQRGLLKVQLFPKLRKEGTFVNIEDL
jgi:HSP20 family protein